MATETPLRPIIRVRGRSFMALVLAPEPPINAWLTALDEQLAPASMGKAIPSSAN